MMIKNTLLSILVVLSVIAFASCEKDDPSILKIFVRSSDNILTPDARVRIVGDIDKETPEYFDERNTDESGVATFNLDDLFDDYGKKDDKVAHFTVYAKDTAEFYTVEKARAKQHLTTTETIILKD